MKILKRIIALTVLAWWLPASMHCSLEIIPGFNLLDWCCDTAAQPAKDDCDRDGCAEIEAGLYRVEDNPTLTPSPAIVLAADLPFDTLPLSRPAGPALLASGLPPPELAVTWQFSHRAAVPVRAPSLVS